MCGIAGIFHYATEAPVDGRLLRRMTRLLRHRGPDDEGFYEAPGIGLGHRRLSIVDLTPTGHQPMSSQSASSWITFNGEFYNHAQFRRELEKKGYRFRGSSDTETLVNLIEESGPDALEGVAAIFAFGQWNRESRTLTLARDPLGVKQLYYFDDGEKVVFASEMKALLVHPDVPRELDPEALNQYVHFHTALFERTFFKAIRQVRAGSYLQISPSGRRERQYWQVDDFDQHLSPEDASRELLTLLQQVVADQLMSDVPVGSFFSGGIDSTAVAEFARRAGRKPQCFGVHFTNQGVIDERPFQEEAARSVGVDLDLITLDGSKFPEDLMRLMYYQDQPVIGPAMFPMYYVSQLASRKVKVCLGGQAADEIFGGYARYALTHPLTVLRNWYRSTGDDGAQKPGSARVGGNLRRQLHWGNVVRLVRGVRHLTDWRARYFEHFAKVPDTTWRQVLAPELVSRDRAWQTFTDVLSKSRATDPATKAMHWDMQTYLCGLFQQDDRMSMAHSLESRVPLADPRIVRFAFRCGFELKFRNGATKWLLRRALADVLPAHVLNRRKVGFDTPYQSWMNGRHAGFIRETMLSQKARSRGFYALENVERLLDGQIGGAHRMDVLWKLLAVETWAIDFLDRYADSAFAESESTPVFAVAAR